MIHDTLSSSNLYTAVHPLFAEAFAFLKDFDPSTADGKIQIRGGDLTAVVQRYATKPASERQFEAHRDFIDIQFIVDGCETMECAPEGPFPVKAPYNPDKDAELYHDSPDGASSLLVKPGDYCIFFPHDVHKPGCNTSSGTQTVFKVVVKVRIAAATGS